MNNFCVYEHYRPRTNIPFYVGKGYPHRAYKINGRNKWWHNIVNKNGFEVRIVLDNLSEIDALWAEANLIAGWGRADLNEGPLVNVTDGWDGMSGYKRTTVQKIKQSRIMRAKMTPVLRKRISDKMKQHKRTKKHCRNLSKALMGQQNALGCKHSKESISRSCRHLWGNKYSVGLKRTKKQRKAVSDAQKGKPKSSLHRRRLKAAWIVRKNRDYPHLIGDHNAN